MTAGSEQWSARDLDPLSIASTGTALTGAASFVWPDLVPGAVSLAALTSFVVWMRALRALKRKRESGYHPIRLIPLLALGGAGWSIALLVGPSNSPGRAMVLGIVCLVIWFLARSDWVGV